jgi:hypothetical protein
MESEFPEVDAPARSGYQNLTVREVLKETSGDSLAFGGALDQFRFDEDTAPAPPRRSWERWRRWPLSLRGRRDQALALIGLVVLIVAFAYCLTRPQYGTGSNSNSAPLQGVLSPKSFSGGWQRWPDIIQGSTGSDGHSFVTTTYQHGASVANLWVQWIATPATPEDAAWERFNQENHVVYSPTGARPIPSREVTIDGTECRMLLVPQDQSGTSRIVPDAWLPSVGQCAIVWQVEGYVMLAAGSQSTAMALAKGAIASERGLGITDSYNNNYELPWLR